MRFQKAKSSNLAGNNFSVRLQCDVLAHRSTNSARRSPQGGSLTVQFLQLNETPATTKKCRDWRGESRSLGVSTADSLRCNSEIVSSVLFASYSLISAPSNCVKVDPTSNCYFITFP